MGGILGITRETRWANQFWFRVLRRKTGVGSAPSAVVEIVAYLDCAFSSCTGQHRSVVLPKFTWPTIESCLLTFFNQACLKEFLLFLVKNLLTLSGRAPQLVAVGACSLPQARETVSPSPLRPPNITGYLIGCPISQVSDVLFAHDVCILGCMVGTATFFQFRPKCPI
jgi:hypothetical protein